MLARDRFTTTMEHREPDRVPIDLGGEVTGISIGASAALKRHLGIDAPDEVADRVQQLAIPHGAILERLHVDSRYYYLRPSSDRHDIELTDDSYRDEFGMTRRAAVRPDGQLLYYDMVSHPLAEAKTVEDLARYPWPDPHDSARFAGLEEMVGATLRGSDKAVTVNHIASAFEFSWYLRGLAEFLTDLMTNRKLAEAQLDAMLEYQCALMGEILDRVGGHLTFVSTGSDLGTQRGPLINPEVYRSVIWPRYRRLWEFIRARTDAKIFYHSCGSIVPIIPLLIEGGVDAIHPVQPGAAGMGDPDRVEAPVWGGYHVLGWLRSSRSTLPFGTPDQVRAEARRLLDEFMPGGGFVFAAGHNIQADVPAENILALFDTIEEYGRY